MIPIPQELRSITRHTGLTGRVQRELENDNPIGYLIAWSHILTLQLDKAQRQENYRNTLGHYVCGYNPLKQYQLTEMIRDHFQKTLAQSNPYEPRH